MQLLVLPLLEADDHVDAGPACVDVLYHMVGVGVVADKVALMEREPVSIYVGVDPTGKSLHVGHMVPIFAMAHLQKFGHRPLIIAGGGTGLIGDPSGKTEIRRCGRSSR